MTRLSVMLDGRMLIGRFSGVGRVVTSLADELAKCADMRVVVLCGQGGYSPWETRRDIEVVESEFRGTDRTATRRLLWEETRLRKLIRQANVDVFHATWNTGVPARCPVPTVLTIHDLIPWNNPAAYCANAAQRLCHRFAVRSSIRRAVCVTTVSEHVRRQVLRAFRVDPARVMTVPNGVHVPQADVRPQHDAERPYALYVGGHERRKNVVAILAAMDSYWSRYGAELQLRLTGDASSLDCGAAKVHRQMVSRGPVRFLGRVEDEELARQYAGASVLLMLSLDEGFGLPVLEAMAHGCPVVAATEAALPEVVGDAGVLVDPRDSNAVADAVRRIVTDADWHSELRRRGLGRASAFSWTATGSRMRGVYEMALQGESRRAGSRKDHARLARSVLGPQCPLDRVRNRPLLPPAELAAGSVDVRTAAPPQINVNAHRTQH